MKAVSLFQTLLLEKMLSLRSSLHNIARGAAKSSAKSSKPRSLVAKRSAFVAPKKWYSTGSGPFRVEKDTFGDISVPADRYWGAQTQRYAALSVWNF